MTTLHISESIYLDFVMSTLFRDIPVTLLYLMDYMLKEGKCTCTETCMLIRGAHYSVGVSHGCTQLEKKKEGRKEQVNKKSKYRKFVVNVDLK